MVVHGSGILDTKYYVGDCTVHSLVQISPAGLFALLFLRLKLVDCDASLSLIPLLGFLIFYE